VVRRLMLSSLMVTIAGLSTGCVADGISTAMSRTRDLLRTDAAGSSDELSPEFHEARRTFRRNTEKNLLAWARYQEDVGEYAEAMKKYREITIAYPECVDAHLGMARIERTTGRVSQAEQILTGLVSRFPNNAQVRLELSQLYSSQEQWDKSIAACEAACQVAPHDQSCRYELGIVLARAGQLEKALPHLTFAVGAPAAHYNVAFILHRDGNDAEAAKWLNQALSLHPDAKTAEKSRALLASLPREYASEAIHGTLAKQ
jgi:tetratricopeptide (TPR) repeat protein